MKCVCKYSTWYVHKLRLWHQELPSWRMEVFWDFPCTYALVQSWWWNKRLSRMLRKESALWQVRWWTTLAFFWIHWWKPSKSQIQNHHGSQSTALVSVNKKFCNVTCFLKVTTSVIVVLRYCLLHWYALSVICVLMLLWVWSAVGFFVESVGYWYSAKNMGTKHARRMSAVGNVWAHLLFFSFFCDTILHLDFYRTWWKLDKFSKLGKKNAAASHSDFLNENRNIYTSLCKIFPA